MPPSYRDHPCEVCGQWGSYGYWVGPIELSRWWCREHRPPWYGKPSGPDYKPPAPNPHQDSFDTSLFE